MPDKEKQDKIIEELKRRAKDVRFGEMLVSFKIHDGDIMAGEIVEQKIKLG